VKSLKGLSDMIQSTLSFVVGCAWSDIVTLLFITLGEPPSPVVFMKNVGVCIGLTILVSLFIISTGQTSSLSDASSREATEAFLMINGAAFFVGWTWLVVIRDLHAQYNRMLEASLEPLVAATFAPQLAEYHVDAFYVVAVVAVVSFSLALTTIFFSGSACVFSALEAVEAEQKAKEEAVHKKRLLLAKEHSSAKELV